MPSEKRDFIFEIGADFLREIYLVPGPDADVRGWEAELQVRPAVNDTGIVLELSTANGRITMEYGRILLHVAADIALDLSPLTRRGCVQEPRPDGGLPYEARGQIGSYDLELTAPDGRIVRFLHGDFCFSPNVTR